MVLSTKQRNPAHNSRNFSRNNIFSRKKIFQPLLALSAKVSRNAFLPDDIQAAEDNEEKGVMSGTAAGCHDDTTALEQPADLQQVAPQLALAMRFEFRPNKRPAGGYHYVRTFPLGPFCFCFRLGTKKSSNILKRTCDKVSLAVTSTNLRLLLL
jgi:hypothetical protein